MQFTQAQNKCPYVAKPLRTLTATAFRQTTLKFKRKRRAIQTKLTYTLLPSTA
jgi:hypothetical protein